MADFARGQALAPPMPTTRSALMQQSINEAHHYRFLSLRFNHDLMMRSGHRGLRRCLAGPAAR
ncbi:MAG: hypothetical protein M3O28_03115 [Actinomycetota bacterium]|nr:hypothetical protein [Actinomycetota bacterium]